MSYPTDFAAQVLPAPALWQDGLHLALTALEGFGHSPDLPAKVALAFGSASVEKTQSLIENLWLGLDLPDIVALAKPLCKRIDGTEIGGGIGAFWDNTIYLSEAFLTANRQNPQAVAAVLLEEIGHYLDQQLNTTDSPGDEGSIFSALVLDRALSPANFAALRAEDDRWVQGDRSLELATYGNINVNGSLTDWQASERLDYQPAIGQLGYEVYGKYADNAYLFAISSPQAIGPGSTIWLNTDQKLDTGFKVFGFAGGAEFNIQVGADGKAALYSGSEGQTLVSSLDYVLSADGKQLEVAVPTNLLGSPRAIDVIADVNNTVFLPGDYNLYKYTVQQNPFVAKSNYGDIGIDGSITDWKNLDRLDLLPGSGQTGYKVYAKPTVDGYAFAIESAIEIGTNTTFWLNTDRNATTGYQIFGSTGGAELHINLASDGRAYLYSGATSETLIGRLDYALSADRKTLEVAVGKDLLPVIGSGIDVLADVNNQVFLPGNYSSTPYTVGATALPTRTDFSKKVGIVYSAASADRFFDKKAYSQLFTAAQSQAVQAGVPFDILTEDDLKDLNKIVQYDALVFPSFNNVNSANVDAIEKNLIAASYKYGVGMIASGDFMTANETGAALAGDPTRRLKALFDVSRTGGGGVASNTINIKDTSLLASSYAAGEQIGSYATLPFAVYGGLNQSGTVLAEQTVNGQKYNAVVATQTGGRNVHFANETLFADTNLVWQGLNWSVYNNQPTVQLDVTRNNSLFLSRDDVDRSKSLLEAVPTETKLGQILTDWKQKYNFVGSHYINIGLNATDPQPPYAIIDPNEPDGPNWAALRPIYQKWLDLGNEIGTHSYTHPFNTSQLTATQLEFEFNQSKLEIARQLGIDVRGAAVPGNPENLAVDQELAKYFPYFSGVGSSYQGAFGFLTPESQSVYLAPNLSFDFNLIEFRKLSATQANAEWLKEYGNITRHGSKPFVEFSWHDYGVTEIPAAVTAGYTRAMYEDFLAKVAADGTEFTTLDDAQQRFRAFEKSQLTIDRVGDQINAKVVATDVGKFALDVMDKGSNRQIKNVTNYYAYDNDSVFLTKTGGDFQINLGAAPDRVTHITALAQRAELLSVIGDGTNLNFAFNGEGKISVALADRPVGKTVAVNGADRFVVNGDVLELTFDRNTQHQVAINFVDGTGNPPPNPDPNPQPPNGNTAIFKEDFFFENADRPAPRSIDLRSLFSTNAPIVVNSLTTSNGELVKPVVTGDKLNLQYQFYQFGMGIVELQATAGNETLQGVFEVEVEADRQLISGTAGNDNLVATDTNYAILKGGAGSDTLNGAGSDDVLIGSDGQILGAIEVDRLVGNGGADLFILGSDRQSYYEAPGSVALVADFSVDDGDVIQLYGKASDYTITSTVTADGTAALGIQRVLADRLETIGLVVGVSTLDLNSSAFSYLS
jgi:peptidoglycan/xylan/chitin deacetylase (PgdA/CDA1 family)